MRLLLLAALVGALCLVKPAGAFLSSPFPSSRPLQARRPGQTLQMMARRQYEKFSRANFLTTSVILTTASLPFLRTSQKPVDIIETINNGGGSVPQGAPFSFSKAKDEALEDILAVVERYSSGGLPDGQGTPRLAQAGGDAVKVDFGPRETAVVFQFTERGTLVVKPVSGSGSTAPCTGIDAARINFFGRELTTLGGWKYTGFPSTMCKDE